MRASLEQSIAAYDDAPDIENKKHLAIVAIERMRMYLEAEVTPQPRRRNAIVDDHTWGGGFTLGGRGWEGGSSAPSTRLLPIAITDRRPFEYEGVTYPTVQHAFQAHKCPEDERENVASMNLSDALDAGRRASIDISAWDANKAKLMYRLVKEQARHHETMIDALIEHKDEDIVVDDVHDLYWPDTLPKIYKQLGQKLAAMATEATSAHSSDKTKSRDKTTEEGQGESSQSSAVSAKRARKNE